MGVVEARMHDHCRRFEHLGVRRLDCFADPGDFAVLDENVAWGEVTDRRVQGYDPSALQQHPILAHPTDPIRRCLPSRWTAASAETWLRALLDSCSQYLRVHRT